MQGFLTRHDASVVGVLHGFDRVLFRGTLRSISYLAGMDAWLASQHVLYKNFGNFAEAISQRVRDHARQFAEKDGNCFTRIDDVQTAQRMMDDLQRRNWCSFLNVLARRVNPWANSSNPLDLHGYYWTLRESEYATDVMFRDDGSLAAIDPALVSHAISQFDCHDVMRFLGRRTNSRFRGEASSNVKRRIEGVRGKHWVEENSIKMYDKGGSVLRIETTMNNPRRFKVRRQATRKGHSVLAWIPLRKSVADITRRVEIGRAANERYFEALGVVGEPSPTHQLLDPVSKRITRRGRSYRALRPMDPVEATRFAALLDGEFLLHGFRNRDLRRRIYPRARTADDRRRASGRITRMLRLLRAHGLIRKVSHTFHYRVTSKGQRLMTTSLRLRRTSFLALAT